ncbi:hypothetical protein [Hydrotalea sandarakina]|jgi:hypothetical protein|uniref:Uncharacterized protein n=1 Tax=Hydrotalea sandarakina TaxID=1004304 RepID=A0A2W7S4S2_9BACT|nr:hypothetical protein [Hydrotalea sandarakina]PZX62267.1 hypothetical protein LX80_01749 [Hydrotalea sandarakina]
MKTKKRVVSYSLYGSKPMYLLGAIENIKTAAWLFPDFICRFYVDDTVPATFLEQIKQYKNVEVIDMTGSNLPKMTWRFLPADDSNVELFLSRDADSRLSTREKWIIEDWMQHGKQFLLIKDHPVFYKGFLMMGGLWGMKNLFPYGMEQMIRNWWQQYPQAGLEIYNDDQHFLSSVIYPAILDELSYYDNYNLNGLPFAQKIKIRRKNFHFIGEAFDENNQRLGHYKELRNYHLKQLGLPGKWFVKLLYKLKV